MSSGLRDYVGGKYADLMQKFWVALKGSGVVLGSNLNTWVQSLDQGPLLGRRFHTCAPGQVPQFFNKNKDSIPPSEAITWRNGRPYINEGVVDMSMGGCTPGVGVDIGAGPVPVYGASVADSLSFHGREGLPFDAGAMLLSDRPRASGSRAGMKAKSKKRKHRSTKHKTKSKKKAKKPRKGHKSRKTRK